MYTYLDAAELCGAARHVEARPPHGRRHPRQQGLLFLLLFLFLLWGPREDDHREEPVPMRGDRWGRSGQEDAVLLH